MLPKPRLSYVCLCGIVFATASIQAETSSSSNDAIELSPFVVSTKNDNNYLVASSISATRLDTPIIDTPVTINVLSRNLMDDVGAFDLKRGLEMISGVAKDQATNVFGDTAITIRGLQGPAVFRNGFTYAVEAMVDAASINRVEVIKGPASVLYGNAAPGGLVNYLTQAPTSTNAAAIRTYFGSYDFKRAQVDANYSIKGSNAVRLNAAWVDTGSFRRFEKGDSWIFAPAVKLKLAENTELLIEADTGSVNKVEPRILSGFFGPTSADSYILTSLPLNYNPGGNNSRTKRDSSSLTGTIDHKINDTVSTRFAASTWGYKAASTNVNGHFGLQSPSFQTINIQPRYQEADETMWQVRNDWLVNFKTAGISHRVVAAFDVSERDAYRAIYLAPNRLNAINVYQFNSLPDSAFDIPLFPDSSYALNARAHAITTNKAASISDSFSMLNDRFLGLVGVRYDHIRLKEPITARSSSTTKVSPQASLLYKLQDDLSAFVSYSTSLQPNPLDSNGNLFDPQEGEGLEGGFKFALKNNKISGTVSYFKIKRQNIPVTVFTTNTTTLVVTSNTALAGEHQSKGFDTDWVFTLNDNWQIIANYAHVDAVVTRGRAGATVSLPSPDQDLPPDRAPKHTGNIWTKYRFSSGSLNGLSIAGGVNFVSRMIGQRSGPVTTSGDKDRYIYLDAHTRLDASIDYSVNDNLTIGIKCNNLTDERYLETVGFWAPPRTFTGSLVWKF